MQINISREVKISKKNRPFIVAEISGNHNGNKKKFLDHIKFAKKAGADMVKIQTYEPEDITINSRKKKFKVKKGIWKGKYLWDLYKKAHTPFEWHKDAFLLAKKIGIPIFSTPFSERALKFLIKLNPPLYKIASFEITDLNLIRCIAKQKKPIIISTGMATFKEIDRAIEEIKKFHNKIILLYCVSGYPTPESDSNVLTIETYKKKYKDYIIGISDHTDNINSSIAAIALGAKVIEKHFKISDKIRSTDSEFSLNFNLLRELKTRSEKIFLSLGSNLKELKKSEKNSKFLRRSIYANMKIKKGTKLSKKNIVTKRPSIGIGSEYFFKILGKKIKKNKKKFDPIYSNDF